MKKSESTKLKATPHLNNNNNNKTKKTNQTKNLSKNKTEKQTAETVRTFEAGCAIKITTARFILVISFFNLP